MLARVKKVRVLFVCMGNICRSPTAEAVLRHKLSIAGLDAEVATESAGTHAHWHAGEPADPRSRNHAQRRGYDLSRHRARLIADDDFERFDLILAMDWDNVAALEARCPEPHRVKLRRLSEFARGAAEEVVPDPYYAGPAAFDRVLDLVEDACDGVIDQLRERL
jgi:protein-tyrosine phosphatase